MTTQQPLDGFETELLAELRGTVAEADASTAPRRPRWRRPAISVGMAAAATATVFLATSGIGPGGTSTASAADVLLGAARQAESAAPADGIYWHVRTIESIDEGKVKRTLDEQHWQRKDGVLWASDNSDRATEIKNSGFDLCEEQVDYAALQALPTDADALRTALEDAMLHGDDGTLTTDAQERDRFVTDCTIGLLTMPVSREVRGAAFRSLAALPDTQNLGSTTDRQGRVGSELVFGDGEYSQHIVIDPDSGTLLQYDFDGEKGHREATVIETGWTDTIRP
jgi:hypothetical protein